MTSDIWRRCCAFLTNKADIQAQESRTTSPNFLRTTEGETHQEFTPNWSGPQYVGFMRLEYSHLRNGDFQTALSFAASPGQSSFLCGRPRTVFLFCGRSLKIQRTFFLSKAAELSCLRFRALLPFPFRRLCRVWQGHT